MSKKFRIGNDIPVRWILKDGSGEPYDLTGKSYKIYLVNHSKLMRISTPTVEVNVVSFVYYGKDQKLDGQYGLMLVENDGQVDMVTYDVLDAFWIVRHSWLIEQGEDPACVETDCVEITSRVTPDPITAEDVIMALGYTPADEDDLDGKADKVDGAVAGHLASLDANGNLTDSGIPASGGGGFQHVYSGSLASVTNPAEGDICIVPAHDDVPAEAYEYLNGEWQSRDDISDAIALAQSAYQKPESGIPAADLASGVIPDISGKEDKSNKVTSLSGSSTDAQYPSAKVVYDALPKTLVSSLYVMPDTYDTTKDIQESTAALGISEDDLNDLFAGKYEKIKFGDDTLDVTVVNGQSPWRVKFVSPDMLTEYILYGITIMAGGVFLVGTTLYKGAAVQFTEQSLSAAQREQARANIMAEAAWQDLPVLYNYSSSTTAEQKAHNLEVLDAICTNTSLANPKQRVAIDDSGFYTNHITVYYAYKNGSEYIVYGYGYLFELFWANYCEVTIKSTDGELDFAITQVLKDPIAVPFTDAELAAATENVEYTIAKTTDTSDVLTADNDLADSQLYRYKNSLSYGFKPDVQTVWDRDYYDVFFDTDDKTIRMRVYYDKHITILWWHKAEQDNYLIGDSSSPYGGTPLELESKANRVNALTGNEADTSKYPSTKALADALGKMGVVSQTQTWTGSDANGWTYAMSDIVRGLIPQAAIDLYTEAGATFNATTGYFELNGLTDLSYEEIKLAYKFSYNTNGEWTNISTGVDICNIRTNFPLKKGQVIDGGIAAYKRGIVTTLYYFGLLPNLEVFCLTYGDDTQLTLSSYSGYLFYQIPTRLREVIGGLNVYNGGRIDENYFFNACYFLEKLHLVDLRKNVMLKNLKALALESVVFAVDHSANGSTAITITLHATAYARCQADTTTYTYNGNTYTGVIAYGAAKNITITSA
jgi:hypothetical protein